MIGIVLGSGLGAFADALEDRRETPFEIQSNVTGHAGKWVEGRLSSADVLVMAGRLHLYQGFTAHEVTFGIREFVRRGVKRVILTNAAGGINLSYKPGELVIISDHINLQGTSALAGSGRFVDMSDTYSMDLRALARSIAPSLKEGVYAGVLGPQYETPAEIRYLRTIGADLVGMSIVQEAIAARALGMEVLGISCVTNMAAGVLPQKLSHEEVLATGKQVEEVFTRLLRSVVQSLARL
jgi:purine-nucleoside phosphorylase